MEEAGRSIEKAHRRLTTHLNKTDTVKEEEESTSDSNDTDRQERTLTNQRYSQRQSKSISRSGFPSNLYLFLVKLIVIQRKKQLFLPIPY